jgi:hypothetical protein
MLGRHEVSRNLEDHLEESELELMDRIGRKTLKVIK